MAARAVEAGDMRYAVGGGVESMSRVPMFSDLGGGLNTLNAALRARYDLVDQGESAERVAEQWHISREESDALARESHRRASAADLGPVKLTDTLAFMFESRWVIRPTAAALELPGLQSDYDDCWQGFDKARLSE